MLLAFHGTNAVICQREDSVFYYAGIAFTDGNGNVCTILDGTLNIVSDSISNVDNLINLVETGSVNIESTSIVNLDGLNNIKETGFINILNCDSLTRARFMNLETINGRLYIDNNPSIVTIDGFNKVTELNWKLVISENDKLTTISGFNNLITIIYPNYYRESDIVISSNSNLKTVSGFSQLSYLDELSLSGQINTNSLLDIGLDIYKELYIFTVEEIICQQTVNINMIPGATTEIVIYHNDVRNILTSIEEISGWCSSPPTLQPTSSPTKFPTPPPTESEPLNIGIIAGPVAGVLILGACIYSCFFKKPNLDNLPIIVEQGQGQVINQASIKFDL